METDHLIDNFNAVLTTINKQRPNRGGKFITRVHFTTPNSKEIFKIDPVDFPFPDYERPGGELPQQPQKKSKKKGQTEEKFVRTYNLFRTPV